MLVWTASRHKGVYTAVDAVKFSPPLATAGDFCSVQQTSECKHQLQSYPAQCILLKQTSSLKIDLKQILTLTSVKSAYKIVAGPAQGDTSLVQHLPGSPYQCLSTVCSILLYSDCTSSQNEGRKQNTNASKCLAGEAQLQHYLK